MSLQGAFVNLGVATTSSTVVLEALPTDGDSKKLLISGATSIISVIVVEGFKLLKSWLSKRRVKKSYNVERKS